MGGSSLAVVVVARAFVDAIFATAAASRAAGLSRGGTAD